MADFVTEKTMIPASPAEIMAVLRDFVRYPEWARDLKAVEVLGTDDEGRGRDVRFRAAAMGRSTSYTLRYDHSDPDRLSWKLIAGDLTRKLDGYYELAPRADGHTDVSYQLEVDLILPIPGFIKRRTQSKISHTALRELKARVEAPDS
jgi:ribosome-associated toxin RatA of RatAB toxin-antitoxin module